ncbi:MAG: hypothetical protein HY356_06440 [Gammaproteobacteria bacterium]|nr:hypothetical protein [Gammaproteobacteria bacterium]
MASRKELNECQVIVDRANHSFILTHDSYIDCSEAYGLIRSNIVEQMKAERNQPKGNASNEVLKMVIAAVEDGPKLTPRMQRYILDSLTPLIKYSI